MEAIMLLLRPLDSAFPIERQLGVDASPVVLVNVFTLDMDRSGFSGGYFG